MYFDNIANSGGNIKDTFFQLNSENLFFTYCENMFKNNCTFIELLKQQPATIDIKLFYFQEIKKMFSEIANAKKIIIDFTLHIDEYYNSFLLFENVYNDKITGRLLFK